jgi:hypothetical protein
MKGKSTRTASARKPVTKRERMMTDKESPELLESAGQALAMVRARPGTISSTPADLTNRPKPHVCSSGRDAFLLSRSR